MTERCSLAVPHADGGRCGLHQGHSGDCRVLSDVVLPQPALPPSPEGWEQVKERDHVFGHKCYFKSEVDAAKAASDRQIEELRSERDSLMASFNAMAASRESALIDLEAAEARVTQLTALVDLANEQVEDRDQLQDIMRREYEERLSQLTAQVEELSELKAEHALLIEHYNQGERLWGEAQIELSELRASVDRLTQEKEALESRVLMQIGDADELAKLRNEIEQWCRYDCEKTLLGSGYTLRASKAEKANTLIHKVLDELQQLRQAHEHLKAEKHGHLVFINELAELIKSQRDYQLNNGWPEEYAAVEKAREMTAALRQPLTEQEPLAALSSSSTPQEQKS